LDPAERRKEIQLKILMYILCAPYVLCRTFMFVEMFVGLRAVPAGIYKTPQWSQYLPSIG
jgi:hypothetical protein